MFYLKRIYIKNFLSFQEASLSLEKAGLYLISGYNELGYDSNGSGKSAILNAICFALFGRTSTGLGPNDVKRWNSSESMEVRLTLIDEKKSYEIIRIDNSVTFLINGEKIGIHKKDIQSIINETFKTNFDLFISSTMFSQNQAEFLAAAGDVTKKKLFKSIFQLERIDKAYEKARDKYDELFSEADSLRREIVYKEDTIIDHKHKSQTYKEKSEEFQEWKNSKIQWLKDKKNTIQITVSVDETPLQNEKALKDRLLKLQEIVSQSEDKMEETEQSLQKLHANKFFLNKLHQENIGILADIIAIASVTTSAVCKYCGQPITRKDIGKHKQELMDANKEILSTVFNRNSEIGQLEATILQHVQYKEDLYKTEKQLLALSAHIEQQRALLRQVQSNIQDLDIDIEKWINMPDEYAETARLELEKYERAKEEKTMLTKKLEDVKMDIDIFGYLKWLLSREGVVSFIIERAFGRLESLANHYLSIISSEKFQVEIKPQRELKSKVLKEEIDIVVKSKDRLVPYWALSDGQRQRVNIALLIAVYRLCKDRGVNNFAFLLLDEILDLSLASKGQEDVIRLMGYLLEKEVHNIFIISHRDEVEKDFGYQIEVQRNKEGISSIISAIEK